MENHDYTSAWRCDDMSVAISRLRFPLTVMIVMFHCYCFQPAGSLSLYATAAYPFGLTLGETGVPAFFFISGFLFFYSQRPYADKMRTRLRTLVVPYVLWNALVLLAYAALSIAGHPQDIAGKSIADYGVVDYVRAFIDRGDFSGGNGQPMLCPYWYVRNLVLLCIVSPLLRPLLSGVKGLAVIAVLFAWWIVLPYNGMVAQSLLFFSLGAWFSINKVNPLGACTDRFMPWLTAAWGALFVLDIVLNRVTPVQGGLYVHRVVLVTTIFVLLHRASRVRWRMLDNKTLAGSSFWIYTTHYPLVLAISSVHPAGDSWAQLCFYFFSVAAVVTVCLLAYKILGRVAPRLLAVTIGNR